MRMISHETKDTRQPKSSVRWRVAPWSIMSAKKAQPLKESVYRRRSEIVGFKSHPVRLETAARRRHASPPRLLRKDLSGRSVTTLKRGVRICRDGTTRWVFVLGAVALKFGRGARGRRSNRYEACLYGHVSQQRRDMLCPVIWCAPFGFLLVSRAARPLSNDEQKHLMETDKFPDWDWEPTHRTMSCRSNTKPLIGDGLMTAA